MNNEETLEEQQSWRLVLVSNPDYYNVTAMRSTIQINTLIEQKKKSRYICIYITYICFITKGALLNTEGRKFVTNVTLVSTMGKWET
jgi:hypothetical protein